MPVTPVALATVLVKERESLHAAAWPRAATMAGFVAIAMLLLIKPWAPAQGLLAWTALLVLALGLRCGLGLLHQRVLRRRLESVDDPDDALRWVRYHRLAFAFHGLVWASACWFWGYAAGAEASSPLVFFIVAISAGALISTPFDVKAGLSFAVPIMGALLPLLLLRGQGQMLATALIATLTIALAWWSARRAQGLMVEDLKTRLTLKDQESRAQHAQTQVERVELALRQQNGLLDQLLNRTAEGFWFVDNEGVGTDANPAMCRLLGRTLDEIRGHSVMAFFDGPDLTIMRREIAARQRGEHLGSYEIGINRPDGSRIYCLNQATALFDTQGKKLGSVGIWTDITQRREAESALRMYQVVTNSTTDLVSVISEGHVFRMVNDAWCKAVGWPRSEALGRLATDLLRPEDRQHRVQAFERCVRTRQPTTVAGMVHFPNRRSRLIETTFSPLAEPLNGEACLVSISRDVTEREDARRALVAGAEDLRRTLGATGDAIFASDSDDPDAPVRFSNENMLSLWGIKLSAGQSLTARTIMAHATPLFADPQAEVQRIQTLIALSAPDESQVQLRDGRTLLRRCIPAQVGGRVLRVWSFRDITAEVQRLHVVQRAEAELRSVLNAFPGFIGRLDADLVYTYANDGLAKLFGKTPEEVVGRPAQEFLGPDRVAELRPLAQRVLAGETVTYEHRHPLADGASGFDYQVTLAPGRDPATGAASIYGFAIDISARTAAERALEAARDEAQRANLAKSEFLSHMSHELRTPLNAILGFGQLLASGDTHVLPQPQQTWVQEVLNGARHLLSLINEILDLGRIEAGHLELDLATVSLAGPVRECLTLLEPLAWSREVQVSMQTDGAWAQALVRADRVRLKQVLLNLMSNAIKYNHRGGLVELLCRTEADTVWLGVSDNGPGIAEQDQPRLFQPFERLGAAGSGVEGTGIGLALSRRLVVAMGGSIGVESQAGAGSLFWFRLPRVLAADPALEATLPAPPKAVHPAAAQKCRVLYIEDNIVNISLMQAILSRVPDVDLLCTESPVEGLELAQSWQPALILTDIQLPGMDGFEVLARLRASVATRSIPVVAISANAHQSDIDAAQAAGFQSYMTKPLDLDLLLDMVQRHLPQAT